MYKFLDLIGMPGVFLFFLAVVLGTIFLLKYLLNKKTEQLISEGSKSEDYLTKKYYSVDNHKYRGLISNVGIAVSLALVLTAFEYPDFEEQTLVDLGILDSDMEEMIEIPPTEQKPPPPPKIQQPEIIEVPDEEEIEEEIEIDLDMEADEETVIEEVIIEEEPEPEEEVEQIFEIVEDNATPKGGMKAFYKYVGKNIKYPNQAKRMGVEGKVFVQFVVDKDGSLTDVKVIRGIGAGCDEEAKRILEKAPKWNPGKQRGRAVKQRIVLPINFKLG